MSIMPGYEKGASNVAYSGIMEGSMELDTWVWMEKEAYTGRILGMDLCQLESELDSWPDEVVSEAEVIDIHADALDGNNCSRVNGGWLVIAAPFISWNRSETIHPLERSVTMLVTKPDSSVGVECGLRHKPYVGQRFTAIHIAWDNLRRLRLYFLLLETVQGFDHREESVNEPAVSIISIH